MRWQIPEPLEFGWKMRETSSAQITRRVLPDGRIEQVISHQVLPNITPELLLWWFTVIDQTVEFRGVRCLAYRLWHPRDHIHFKVHGRSPDGGVGPGAKFHIVEAFGGRPEFLVDQVFRVAKMDPSGFRLEMSQLGRLVASLDEDWTQVDGGLQYTVTMRVGLTGPLRLVNPVIRSRERARLEAWLTHNVEEVGNIPLFLPELHAQMAKKS